MRLALSDDLISSSLHLNPWSLEFKIPMNKNGFKNSAKEIGGLARDPPWPIGPLRFSAGP